jgi:hypothetical protein
MSLKKKHQSKPSDKEVKKIKMNMMDEDHPGGQARMLQIEQKSHLNMRGQGKDEKMNNCGRNLILA